MHEIKKKNVGFTAKIRLNFYMDYDDHLINSINNFKKFKKFKKNNRLIIDFCEKTFVLFRFFCFEHSKDSKEPKKFSLFIGFANFVYI